MGAKRAAPSPSKPAKAAKKGDAQQPEDKQWQPALDLLREVSSELPVSCADMLRGALPHALATAKADRHAFQNTIIDTLTSLSAEEEERRRAAVKAIEANVAANVAERDEASGQIDERKKEESEKQEERNAKAAIVKDDEAAVQVATVELEKQQAELAEAQKRVTSAVGAKQEFIEKVESVWPKLEVCGFEKKDWRARNKAIDTLIQCLACAPQSLSAALPVVLKAGAPEERVDFAKAVISHANMALKGKTDAMSAEIAALEGAAADRVQAVSEAEARVKQCQNKLDIVMQEAMDADNKWVDANTKVFDLQSSISDFSRKEGQLCAELDTATKVLESLQAVAKSFGNIVEGAPTVAVSEAPQGEEPGTQNEPIVPAEPTEQSA